MIFENSSDTSPVLTLCTRDRTRKWYDPYRRFLDNSATVGEEMVLRAHEVPDKKPVTPTKYF